MLSSEKDVGTIWINSNNDIIYVDIIDSDTIELDSSSYQYDVRWPVRGRSENGLWWRYNLSGIRYDGIFPIIKQITKQENPEFFL